MENLSIYNTVRQPPKEALRAIGGGRLKGKTDINPMWRIKALTEAFGPCGIGWRIVITKQWIEQGNDGEVAVFCNIDLYVKVDGEWSQPIPGTGGNALVVKEKNGLYTSDECYKMAYTDAISVACKLLGVGADIYWDADRTQCSQPQAPPAQKEETLTQEQESSLRDLLSQGQAFNEAEFCRQAKISKLSELAQSRFRGAFNYAQSIIAQEAAQ